MAPCFLGSEGQDRRKQSAERVENSVHYYLCRATARRIRRVAIHPVFCDVDVEAAQIDCAKLVERMIDLVKSERFVTSSTICDHVIESLQNPAINQSKIFFPAFLFSCFEVVKISQQNA